MRTIAIVAVLCVGCSYTPDPRDDTTLNCPFPGTLPFDVASHGFVSPANAAIAASQPRVKDEASDVMGVPGGPMANVYLSDTGTPSQTTPDYQGVQGRTSVDEGANLTPLAGENVSLWFYDDASHKWDQVARTTTDANGGYDLASTDFVAPNGAAIYSVLEADNSCTFHRDWLFPPGTVVVAVDIDGTLTADDNEFTLQIVNGDYTPVEMKAGADMCQAWVNRGYQIIYLTARTHDFDFETRMWLNQLGFPPGLVITSQGELGENVFKSLWLERFVNDFGWVVWAGYGNHTTDAAAYASINLPASNTFIIGPDGPIAGTTFIENDDYTENINDFIAGQPNLLAN